MENISLRVNNLIAIIRKLRGDKGCPWDRKQTPATLRKYLREEVEELVGAIEADDTANIREEIGDVLYILIMLCEMHEERNLFTLSEAVLEIEEKLIRRHPHVFADVTLSSEEELHKQWQRIKAEEKKRD